MSTQITTLCCIHIPENTSFIPWQKPEITQMTFPILRLPKNLKGEGNPQQFSKVPHTHTHTHRAAKLISIGSTQKAVTSSQYLKHYINPLPPGSSTHIHRVLLIHQILNPLNK